MPKYRHKVRGTEVTTSQTLSGEWVRTDAPAKETKPKSTRTRKTATKAKTEDAEK